MMSELVQGCKSTMILVVGAASSQCFYVSVHLLLLSIFLNKHLQASIQFSRYSNYFLFSISEGSYLVLFIRFEMHLVSHSVFKNRDKKDVCV